MKQPLGRHQEGLLGFLLVFVERAGGRLSRKESSVVVAQYGAQPRLIEQFYDRAAKTVARMRYPGGMVIGLAS